MRSGWLRSRAASTTRPMRWRDPMRPRTRPRFPRPRLARYAVPLVRDRGLAVTDRSSRFGGGNAGGSPQRGGVHALVSRRAAVDGSVPPPQERLQEHGPSGHGRFGHARPHSPPLGWGSPPRHPPLSWPLEAAPRNLSFATTLQLFVHSSPERTSRSRAGRTTGGTSASRRAPRRRPIALRRAELRGRAAVLRGRACLARHARGAAPRGGARLLRPSRELLRVDGAHAGGGVPCRRCRRS